MPPSLTPPSRSSYGSDSSSSSNASISCLERRINFKKLLASFFRRYDPNRITEIDVLLKRNEGKEAKLMLMLAKRYDTSNPLNAVYVKYHARLSTEQLEDFTALATLYLSVFRPSDLSEVDNLLEKYKGKEDELFSKLASNFHAINPLKIRTIEQQVDYRQALTAFFEENDLSKVDEVDATLAKSAGKEAILFSVLAEKYQATNGLDANLKARLADQACNDYISLLQLYLAIFHPACTSSAESMLARYGFGREHELFDILARKFRSTNPLSICKIVKKTDGPAETKNKSLCLSRSLPQSPMIASR
eukprot:scaffold2837_cov210-Skeletonema_menzelii.AAC.3